MMGTKLTKHDCTTKLSWQRRKESRPNEIIEAAFVLFAEKGFTTTTMDEIAHKAGISKGSIYNYFNSKEAIFEAVVTNDIVPILDQIRDAVAKNHQDTSAQFLNCLIQGLITFSQESHLEMIPKLIVSESGNFPDLAKDYIEKIFKPLRGIIETVIQKGVDNKEFINCDPRTTAHLLLAPILLEQIWKYSLKPIDNNNDSELFIDNYMEIFLNGITRDTNCVYK